MVKKEEKLCGGRLNLSKMKKTLKIIEQIVSDDFCYDLEIHFPQTLHEIRKALKEARKKLSKIYQLSHCAVGECKNPHNDWKLK
jgi:hypothetical protein